MGGAIQNLSRAVGGKKKRSPSISAPATASATAAARDMGDEAEATVETDSGMIGRKRKGKKALIAQTAAANVGGEGSSGLNIPVA
tara:strand:- start:2580 stop:2834 length:255 start_codon:yes stop_codon:yes gene_type:complete